MTQSLPILLACSALSFAACGKSDSKAPAADKGAAPAAGKPEAPGATSGPDFSAWDVAGKKQAWQGSWVVKDNGVFQAWTIAGDEVKTFDGTEDKTFQLEVDAPCRAYFKTSDGMSFPHVFAVTGGKLRVRSGGAGFRRGAEAVYCNPSGEIFVLDAAGKCNVWKQKFRDWERADGECGFKTNEAGQEVFFQGGANQSELALEDDAILSRVSADTESAADHEAAKALRASKS
jgi:hypothetical protein